MSTASIMVGLISGTSMDGIDAVAVRLPNAYDTLSATPLTVEWLAAHTFEFSPALSNALNEAREQAEYTQHDDWDQAWVHQLDDALAKAFAQAALDIVALASLSPDQVCAIGSHGQTLVHRPEATPPYSLQLGSPQTIANLTHIPTVGVFRDSDLQAGGQGAPLAPLLHEALFRDENKRRVVINLGGISNVTVLLPNTPVVGFDTGPANVLLDLFYRQHHPEGRFDPSGQWASSGQVLPELLAAFYQEPFFKKAPPKSTGVEYFGKRWLNEHLKDFTHEAPQDIQATLAELTASTLGEALKGFAPIHEVICCGGGAHNLDLLNRLSAKLPDAKVTTSNDWSIDTDHLEALLFAWLAQARLAEHAFDTSSITGAKRPVMLGEVFRPQLP